MTGDFETARQLIREGNEILGELGRMQSAVSHHEALVELLGGQPAAAERCLRLGYDKLEQMGERSLLATTAAMLAQALYARPLRGGRAVRRERGAAPHEDFVTHAMWRGSGPSCSPGRAARAAERSPATRWPDRADRPAHAQDALLDLATSSARGRRRGPTPLAARSALRAQRQPRLAQRASTARSGGGESTEVDDASLAVRQGRDPR